MRLLAVVAFLAALILLAATPQWAYGHYQPGHHNVRHAINLAWCGRSNAYCGASSEAWAVAGCETGYTYSVWARNGQYLGIWQMGDYARSTYGHSWNPWGQARAAHRYYLDAGWRPWECASILGIR